MTDEEYVTAARAQYQKDGEIEVDDGAKVSRGDDPGAYVQAWVWVYDPVLVERMDAELDAEIAEREKTK